MLVTPGNFIIVIWKSISVYKVATISAVSIVNSGHGRDDLNEEDVMTTEYYRRPQLQELF